MADLLLKDVDVDIMRKLELRAQVERITLEDEAKTILGEALGEGKKSLQDFKRLSKVFSEEIGPMEDDSTLYIRQLRDAKI